MCKSCFNSDAFSNLHETTHQHMEAPAPLLHLLPLHQEHQTTTFSWETATGSYRQGFSLKATNTHTPHIQTDTHHELDVHLIVKEFIPFINITGNIDFIIHEHFATGILGNLTKKTWLESVNYCTALWQTKSVPPHSTWVIVRAFCTMMNKNHISQIMFCSIIAKIMLKLQTDLKQLQQCYFR